MTLALKIGDILKGSSVSFMGIEKALNNRTKLQCVGIFMYITLYMHNNL